MPHGSSPSARAAFFDVDETLIGSKSMPSFLRHYYAELGRPADEAQTAIRALTAVAAHGGSRADANRAYYRLFAGHRVTDVAAAGQRWFDAGLRAGNFFHDAVLRALRGHTAAGELTVLVSGSFAACLDPIAAHAGADVVLGTVPDVSDGRYTGEVRHVRIGPGKADAVAALIRDRALRAEDCAAYGDHASDLDLLSQVGHPVAVGDDPVLTEHAHAAGWPRLPAAPPAPPVPGQPAPAPPGPAPPGPATRRHRA